MSIRVAAYCRVSTRLEEQDGSYDIQMDYFREKIEQNPEMSLVGLYGDQGKSGLKLKGRIGFQQLLADCEAGKIENRPTKLIQSDYSCRGSHFDFGGSQNRAVGHTF